VSTPQGTIATVVLDDVDITDLALEGSTTRRLNRPSQATIKVPMQELASRYGTMIPDAGSYLKVYYDAHASTMPQLFHHGRVMQREVTADQNNGYVVFNSQDPMELWQWRPVRDPDGDFSDPDIVAFNQFAPQILHAALTASENPLLIPSLAEGPLRLRINSVAGGVIDMTGAPTDWPMTIMELFSLLVSTGELDAVVTPIEFDASDNYGQLDVFNGNFGNDLHSTVKFQYGMGNFNVQALRWNRDMTNMVNKLWYFLGPKCDQQHWRANVQGDDPGLTYPPGGKSVGPCDTGSVTNNQIGVETCHARTHFDVRMLIKIWDAVGDNTDCTESVVVGHELYRRLWQCEQWLSAQPLELVHITPTRDTEILSFDIGDLVLVEAVGDVVGGFSGVQRVYEYTISWDADSVPALGELQVSSDNEGF